MKVNSVTSYIASVSNRTDYVGFSDTDSSVQQLEVEGTASPDCAAALGHIGYDGRMKALVLKQLRFIARARTNSATATFGGLSGVYGVRRGTGHATGETLQAKTITDAECVYETRLVGFGNSGSDAFMGAEKTVCFHEYPVLVAPFEVYCATNLVRFDASGDIDFFVDIYLEYMPMTLSKKESQDIIIATTGVGGAIERRS